MFFKWKKGKSPDQQKVEQEVPDTAQSDVHDEVVSDSTPNSEPVLPQAIEQTIPAQEQVQPEEKPTAKKPSLFERFKAGLARTSKPLSSGIGALLLGKKTIDDDVLEELETLLLTADIGVEATEEIIDTLTDKLARKELSDPQALQSHLKQLLLDMLTPVEQPLVTESGSDQPYVILVVGVNGVGKTTTIGKLAKRYQSDGKQVMLAAGDTFRAAAVEQLQTWGERNDVPVIAQHTGADSASVIFDALQSAKSRRSDILIADTAGRLHNKSNLMEELAKVKRVMAKLDADAPHEVLLVLDAGTGQNALSQLEQFKDTAGVTGIALTKLDGTARGGVVFALSKRFGIPLRYVGIGEGIDDLQPFSAHAFVDALFN